MKSGLHLLWASLLIGTMTVSANPIDVTQAQGIAKKFCSEAVVKNKMRKAPSNAKMKLVYKSHGKKAGNNLLYAFDRGTASGFVVVAGDDRAPQILGYSDTGSFDINNMPENMRWWIRQYEQQISYLQENPKARLTTPKRNVNVVAPLLGEIAWDQESPYNANCPYMSYYDDYEEETVSGTAPTGCVATALAQVMRYHKWPAESKGSISYTTNTLKQDITADINATYDWDLMLPTYSGVTATDEQKAEVAKLMYNVGVALHSDYSPSGTGATDVDVVPTLIKYFNYDTGARYVQRDYTAVDLYEQGLINEIEAGRPVPYGGVTEKNEGHFFVLDGINEDGYYHVNWGWGGLSNGYYLISSLDPDGQGVGGATSSYTAFKYHQLYIAGLQKPQEGSKTGWNIMADNISEINDTYAKGDEIKTTIYDAYNNSSTYDTLKCKFYWDIYDAEKRPTGRTMKRNDWCLKDGEYHLTVLGVVARPDGTYLITKRVMTKAWAPGWWEVSGGAAQAGESSEEAVCREVREETGLDISNAEGGYVFTYKRENPGEGDNYFVDVYRFVLDIDENDLKLQTEETDGYMFATKEEIENFAKEGIFLHYDSIKRVFEQLQ